MNQSVEYTTESISKWLSKVIASETKMELSSIDVSQQFEALGLDSMKIVNLVGVIERQMGIELDATLLWEHTNIYDVAKYLAGRKHGL